MGRPSRPSHLKILTGERECRINRNEPQPDESTPLPATPLSDGAQEIWRRLAPDLIAKHCLSPWDVDLFTVFCDAASLYYECRALMGSDYSVTGSVKKRPSPHCAAAPGGGVGVHTGRCTQSPEAAL
jgi:phage terminase small subunit